MQKKAASSPKKPVRGAKKAPRPAVKPASKPVRRRLSPDERRSQIVAAARALFVEEGIDHVSMRKIARQVGITQAAIYQHFENKEAILFVIIEGFFDEMLRVFEAALSGGDDVLTRLRRAMRTYVALGLSRPEEYRLVFMTPMSGLVRAGVTLPRTEEAKLTPSPGSLTFGMLDGTLREAQAKGYLRDINPDIASEAIWAAGHGIVSLLITHSQFPWTDKAALVELQLDMLFEGMLPAGSPARRS